MTHLSVNINKIATLRNARGGQIPNVVQMAIDAEKFGAQGITVHPRPDERHITYQDVIDLKKAVTTEFNIEGNPREQRFVDLVLDTMPKQVTLVPDESKQLTSNRGWNTIANRSYLTDVITIFKEKGIRVSIFIDPIKEMVEGAKTVEADRIELYTESYARNYISDREGAVLPFIKVAKMAISNGLEVNAGHDLSLDNLRFFVQMVPEVKEVSIGHALVADALCYGWKNTIQKYLSCLQ